VARVHPFRAIRYATDALDITPVTAPPYDVISDGMRQELLDGDERNIVALELAEGPLDEQAPGNRYETAAQRWHDWRADGILVPDEAPALYVLEQRYELNDREVSRKALIAEVELEPFEAGVILPHERTLPKALGDRFALTRACAANFSQVFGLYPDEPGMTAPLFARAMAAEPIMTATDADGVISTVWAVDDPEVHAEIADVFADKPVFIADGHHRYTTALAYRDERRAAEPEGASDADTAPAYDRVMMALANMDDPDLSVLPTHRLVTAEGALDPDEFYAALAGHFRIEELPEGHPTGALDSAERPAFLVRTSRDERPQRMVLRDDVDMTRDMPADHSQAWRELDVAVLQELVLSPLLGVHPDRPESLSRLAFYKDPHELFGAVGENQVAFALRATRMDQMRAVALAGETMPQKSTYFYPKLLSGLVMRSME
jgi:uncharacterized protein (DUF1015 family)